ncbi:2-dehydropantoate 2-reductase [Leptospira sp. 201903070]|uniref:2-dehydropantoate 2-reductase n=1 Tax=Leptospira ainlahdjerensis TaxID=2810033 RepID=A0ABS2UA11_9LEPT|nr:2-dehydropantoate 2-reductase [Leptospira ainlahdjerensis]MBM9577200.1 2-dehydropantoate 2-reductase [Leptospira ainlahdjerensis]
MFRILVLGSGAIAGLYAGKLKQAGCCVDFWVRKNAFELEERGFQIQSHWGDFEYQPNLVFEEVPKNLEDYDLILNCLKCLPEIRLETILGIRIPENIPILLLQNGIGIEEPITQLYPKNEILSGLAFVCANRLDGGKIHHLDYGDLTIGSWNRNPSSSLMNQLVKLFETGGVPTQGTDTIRQARWKKLLWNAPFNPISVLSGGKNTSQILSEPTGRSLVIEVMREVQKLSELDGASVPLEQIETFIEMTESMKPYKTSMLLDFEAGRPMEIDAILGNALKIGEKFRFKTPHISTLYALLKLKSHSK